jgi:predicted ATP-grasp superfamily ATP-dependent carboligase
MASEGHEYKKVDWPAMRASIPFDQKTREFKIDNYINSKTDKSNPVIIFHAGRTALATARCLALHGLDVHVLRFDGKDISQYSNMFSSIDLTSIKHDEIKICDWLVDFSSKLSFSPVVIPISDQAALFLAKFRDRLHHTCILSESSHSDLKNIISKDMLYTIAGSMGVAVPPTIIEPDIQKLEQWCKNVQAPYLVKPFYFANSDSAIKEKNLIFSHAEDLSSFIKNNGSHGLVIQKFIKSGDGYVYDCYGYCDKKYSIITMASHRRIRQNKPHRGITSFGEIPGIPRGGEDALFESTTKLINGLKYHGIFGIEWIEDQATGELYLVDFNARPFSSIGHLRDCGLNLPYLAYMELTGTALDRFPLVPVLEHRFWIDLGGDIKSFILRRKDGDLGVFQWMRTVLRSSSYAFFSLRDPLPAVYSLFQLMFRPLKLLAGTRKVKSPDV